MDGRETKIFIDNFHSLKAAQLNKRLSSVTATSNACYYFISNEAWVAEGNAF